MTAKTLFTVVLKILGILFIKDILISIPQLVSLLTLNLRSEYGVSFGAMALFVLSIGTYLVLAYYLIFRTELIIDKLKLTTGLDVDPIRLTMHRSTVLTICIIVIGALMVVNSLPFLIREAISYYQQANANKYFSNGATPDKSYLVSYAVQVFIGLLLMGNQRQIVNFIELRRRDSNQTSE